MNLEYGIRPVSQLRDEIEQAAAHWPLAQNTTIESTDCDGVAGTWIGACGRSTLLTPVCLIRGKVSVRRLPAAAR